MLYYAAPLSTLYQVIRTKNSASLSLRLVLANLVNGSLWLVYGTARKDLVIAFPNGVGAAFALVQIGIFFRYRRKRGEPLSDPGDDGLGKVPSTSSLDGLVSA